MRSTPQGGGVRVLFLSGRRFGGLAGIHADLVLIVMIIRPFALYRRLQVHAVGTVAADAQERDKAKNKHS